MMECLLAFTDNDKINLGNTLHPMIGVIAYFRSAKYDFYLWTDLAQHIDDRNRLFNVPNVAGEADYIRLA
ncbi:hypothetical protein D3C85_1849620 [compost metagenome]